MTESPDHDIMRMSNRQLISHLQNLFTRGESQIHQCLEAASYVFPKFSPHFKNYTLLRNFGKLCVQQRARRCV